jgi:murein L,D-transpeptidase YcbB/YkuD
LQILLSDDLRRTPVKTHRSISLRAPAASIAAFVLFVALVPLSGCKGKLKGLEARFHHRKATSPSNSTDYAGQVEDVTNSAQLPILRWPNYAQVQPAVRQFYTDRNDELAWSRDLKPTVSTKILIQLFEDAAKKGLDPEDYDASRWPGRQQRLEKIRSTSDGSDQAQTDVAEFDVAMTVAAMRYLSDLHVGRVNPQSLNFDIDVPTKRASFDVATLLNDKIVDSSDVATIVASVEPQSPLYQATEQALPRYLAMAAEQSAQPQPPLPPLGPKGAKPLVEGGYYPALGPLLARLQLEGDAPGAAPAPAAAVAVAKPAGQHVGKQAGRHPVKRAERFVTKFAAKLHSTPAATAAAQPAKAAAPPPPRPAPRTYNAELVAAVKQYQQRHALNADGKLSQATIDSMNVPLSTRVQQMDDALERWRWLPDNYIQPRVMANLPEFVVRTYGPDHALVFKMEAVDGEADGTHDTPMFVRLMRYVVFRPYWNLPTDIVKKDLVPHAGKAGIGYLARNDYEVTDAEGKPVSGWTLDDLAHGRFRVRQKPGPKNSLGLVKFLFPNEYDIYMHSTPELALFNLPLRDRSHGCVRLQDAGKMALWVLSGDQPDPQTQTMWDADKVNQALNGDDNNKTINLKTPLPVVLAYFTANADEDGTMHFFSDLYGYDAQLEAALAKGRPYAQSPVKINPKLTPGETE